MNTFDEVVRDIQMKEGDQSQVLKSLGKLAITSIQKIKILQTILDEQFDLNPDLSDPIPRVVWKNCVEVVLSLVDVLEQNPDLVMSINIDEVEDAKENFVWGNLCEYISRISYEFYASLKHIDISSLEYDERLEDEALLFVVSRRILNYLEERRDDKGVALVAYILLYLVHYKRQDEYDALWNRSENLEYEYYGIYEYRVQTRKMFLRHSIRSLIERLYTPILRYEDGEKKKCASLCNIYHLALTENFEESSKLMSRFLDEEDVTGCKVLKDTKIDAYTKLMRILNQIYFNRAIVQLGICAFKVGRIVEAYSYLSGLNGGGKVKRLLSQHISHLHFQDKTQDLAHPPKHIPYHMHIDEDVLEAVYFISAMLLEVPNMAAKGEVISQRFRRLLQTSQCKTCTSPELIVAATSALIEGDHETCYANIQSLKIWKKFRDEDNVLMMLHGKINEVGLMSLPGKKELRRHIRFSCPRCNYSFLREDEFNKHLPLCELNNR
ncbi:Ulp1 peptidase [Ranunculus cassubicifolius]